MDACITSTEGVRVPRILYGTAWKKADTARLVTLAIETGFRGIDTACQPKHYDEAGVGAGIAARLTAQLTRSELYLQTKFTSVSGQDPARLPYDPNAALGEQLVQSVAASLRNLQTDYLDCLLLHSPLPSLGQTLELWRAIEALIDAGKIRQAGISNCYALSTLEPLDRNARRKPAVVQNRFYAATGYDREVRAFCRDRNIIYQSFWTLTANPQPLAHPTITGLASGYRRTAAQVLFRYLSQIGVVPLTGTRSATHMREDLSIFDFELSAAECEAVGTIFGG
ncbi:MAG TPA: aldo/keto reductase [Steroidobacteraceae bacterium]|nr:aldo/keto reductase [Steroidobacteraceae bacterium]